MKVPNAPTHALKFKNNWDGEGGIEYYFGFKGEDGEWWSWEDNIPMLEYNGDEVLCAWPLDNSNTPIQAERTE